MDTVKINPASGEDVPLLFQRQFQIEPTPAQRKTDWLFGVIIPTFCVYFDPIVFRGGGLIRGGMFSEYRPFAYTLSFVSIIAMMAWLLWGARLKWLNAGFAGLFTFGAIVSVGVGIVLIPFSLAGLAVLIGLLGFTPLISGFIYLRNARRAFEAARPFIRIKALVPIVAWAFVVSMAVPWAINSHIEKEIELMNTGSAEDVRVAGRRLALIGPLVNPERFVGRYHRMHPEPASLEVKLALARAYFEISGENIDSRKYYD